MLPYQTFHIILTTTVDKSSQTLQLPYWLARILALYLDMGNAMSANQSGNIRRNNLDTFIIKIDWFSFQVVPYD
jgi:hypothetical protein